MSRVAVNIFDQEYVLKGPEPPQYLENLAKLVDRKMKEVQHKNPSLSQFKVAVITALHLADEIAKIKAEYETLIQLIEEEKKV
ncbi:MAG: cell division protein ZapA [Syntrophomonadaceae bacterium]|nr:cell division protein ZapA [Syntrophomonadaceae bacterium]